MAAVGEQLQITAARQAENLKIDPVVVVADTLSSTVDIVTATPGGNAIVTINGTEKLLPLTAVTARPSTPTTPSEKG